LPATAASDVYSFGVILYRMLAGRLPFESESPIELARMHVQERPFPLADARPTAPPALVALAEASLAKDPEARPPDGEALARRLHRRLRLLRPRPCRQPSPFRSRRHHRRLRLRLRLRDLNRHPAPQRGAFDRPPLRRAPGCPRTSGAGVGGRLCRRRLRRRVL